MEGSGEHYVKLDQSITRKEGAYVFINTCNLGSSGDTQGTPVDNGEPSVCKGSGTREGEGQDRSKSVELLS